MRLLVTRPQPDAARTAATLRTRGHDVLLAPLLSVESVDFELPQRRYAAVVMTSANAARAACRHREIAQLASLPLFAVGGHTAEAARGAGFGDVHTARGDKQDLVEIIRARIAPGSAPLLYLAGEDRAGELMIGGVPLVTVVAYRARKARAFPAATATALSRGEILGVLHFSRRTAEAYLDCAGSAGIPERALMPWQFCLSPAVAEPLLGAGAAHVKVAARPDERALLDLVRDELLHPGRSPGPAG
jgi:uroporphyrinogen-III synthase